MSKESMSSFYKDSKEGKIRDQGFLPDEEIPEGTEELHEYLRKMDEGGTRHLEDIAGAAEESIEESGETKKWKRLTQIFGERKESTERPPEYEKLQGIATNMIDALGWRPNQEDFLVITDDMVLEKNPWLLHALDEELKKRSEGAKGKAQIKVVEYQKKSAVPLGEAVGEAMFNKPVLIITAASRSHSRETGKAIRGEAELPITRELLTKLQARMEQTQKDEELGKGFNVSLETIDALLTSDEALAEVNKRLHELAKKSRIRLISITKGHNLDILTKGAVEEKPELLKERAEKIAGLMRDVKEVRIISKNEKGEILTDLTLSPRVDKSEIETGDLSKPGALSNWPVGEWSCAPHIEGANGILVVDGPIGGGHNLDLIKEYGPLKLEIKNGCIMSVNDISLTELLEKLDQGGSSGNVLVDKVASYLKSGDKGNGHAFRLAELGIGTNGKACEGKGDEQIGSSEGEKILGTIHVAFGSNGTFGIGKEDPDFNDCDIHCDNVVGIQNKVTVECTRRDGSKFNLIEEGQPIGY